MMGNEFGQGVTGKSQHLSTGRPDADKVYCKLRKDALESVFQLAARLFWDNFWLMAVVDVPKNYQKK